MTIDEARPGAAPAFLTSDPHDGKRAEIAQQLSDEHLGRLASLQVLTVVDGEPVVPPPLWPSMIEGLSLGLHQLQELEHEYREYEGL